MPSESTGDFGIVAVSSRLRETLRQYIEAQYHIRNEQLIEERRALLDSPGTIFQEPYVEATPSYTFGKDIEQLEIPREARDALAEIAKLNVGIFDKPYEHQVAALEAFLSRDSDIVVATGTGSGKTESFLMPIIGHLATEAAQSPATANDDACRALLLYPMNALVNDQLSRIRKLFGDEDANKIISKGRNRKVRFATYTGRTPYAGIRSAGRDSRYIRPLFDDYYNKLLNADSAIVHKLISRGKWPSKDLPAFFGGDKVEQATFKSGKKVGQLRTVYHWRDRLKTSEKDRELMTRDEVQKTCPDLLITNYSMLEYMLMRPIERSIFSKTRDWLSKDINNKFILVLDEAHLYYGAAGAEVALLLRRLFERLEIPRDRVKCILTSASLGGVQDLENAKTFASALTGLQSSGRIFEIIVGSKEPSLDRTPSLPGLAQLLSIVSVGAIENAAMRLTEAVKEVESLAARFGWEQLRVNCSYEDLADYLFEQLWKLGIVKKLLTLCAGRAIAFNELFSSLFPEEQDPAASRRALAALLALCTLARRRRDQKVLLPARVHMFFRGIPGLWACSDAHCDAKISGNTVGILGKLYLDEHLNCSCEKKARVYELLTHRDCGTAFLRGYIAGWNGRFLWNDRSRPIGAAQIEPLAEIELLVDGNPNSDCRPAWLDVSTGCIKWSIPTNDEEFRKVWAPKLSDRDGDDLTFRSCPVCLVGWKDEATKIMDHQTKGEAPFAALVAMQLSLQPQQSPQTSKTPNGGRKVLLFSDGRQKAARLARDIPRAVEEDVFRQALAVAVSRMGAIPRECKPNNDLYVAFLSVLHDNDLVLFDGEDRETLIRDLKTFRRDFDGSTISSAISDLAADMQPPQQYQRQLLRQICGRFYSLSDATIGFLEPTNSEIAALWQKLSPNIPGLEADDLLPLSVAWVSSCLETYAFNARLSSNIRERAAGYPRKIWGATKSFPKMFRTNLLTTAFEEKAISNLEDAFSDALSQEKQSEGLFVEPRRVKLTVDLNRLWYQCRNCTRLSPVIFRSSCLRCGSQSINSLDPHESAYIKARKSYWRQPVAEAISGSVDLRNVSVEEHTAQLSHRDTGNAHATTERFELRFQDLLIDDDRPIDVLSCTTTMEVGVDIGSLLAVGLRNVPPQRSNYQQRAGRAGRRGAAVSTVMTYAQNGPHDSYYFYRPAEIISGSPKTPRLKTDNAKIARRHLNSFLFQTFFNEAIDDDRLSPNGDTSSLNKSLGLTEEFFRAGNNRINLTSFEDWVARRVKPDDGDIRKRLQTWLPNNLKIGTESISAWVSESVDILLMRLRDFAVNVSPSNVESTSSSKVDDTTAETAMLEAEQALVKPSEMFLEFLFNENLLPSYAFPRNLAGFLIEEYRTTSDFLEVRIKELPQQAMDKALSEYAPGRLVVVNKQTYRSGGVAAATLPNVEDRAAPLFDKSKPLIYCSNCTYVQEKRARDAVNCPVCNSSLEVHETIQPEVFLPENGRALPEDDTEQEFTQATMAQFPVPVGEDLQGLRELGKFAKYTYTVDRKLITVNKGKKTSSGAYSGFLVCQKCGATTLEASAPQFHNRPYLRPHGKGQSPKRCSGTSKSVYLSNEFQTDLLLLRFELKAPIISNAADQAERQILEDALYTISEALASAASLHPELDLDPRELGSGFRIIPVDGGADQIVDVYLYDTSAGGAGYSELAAIYITEITRSAVDLLENCPNQCERSCQDCLRQYHNQHFQHRLDRRLGSQFLRYVLYGEIPARRTSCEQGRELEALARYLRLEGRDCKITSDATAFESPLIIYDGQTILSIGTYPALIAEESVIGESSTAKNFSNSNLDMLFNTYILQRNLPDVHRQISDQLSTL